MTKGKRIFAIAMAMVMGLSVAGCGGKKQPTDSTVEEGTESTGNEARENMIKNGDFSEDLTNWALYLEGGSATQLVNDAGEMEIQVSSPGKKEHAIQPYYDGFSLDMGCVYEY